MKKRNQSVLDFVAEESSLTALTYIDLFFELDKMKWKKSCIERMVCCAARASKILGDLSMKISNALMQGIQQIMKIDVYNAHRHGQLNKSCSKAFIHCRNSKFSCD